jgi:hypothetical protein
MIMAIMSMKFYEEKAQNIPTLKNYQAEAGFKSCAMKILL